LVVLCEFRNRVYLACRSELGVPYWDLWKELRYEECDFRWNIMREIKGRPKEVVGRERRWNCG